MNRSEVEDAYMKLCKQVICYLLTVLLVLGCMGVYADETFTEPGQTEYVTEAIHLTGGKAVTYAFYLPFDMSAMTVSYAAAQNVQLTLATGVQTQSITLSSAAQTAEMSFLTVERKGERTFTLTADQNISINLSFHKYIYDALSVNGAGTFPLTAFSENEKAVGSAVLIDRTASAIVVRGAHRYINYDNPRQCPENIDGSIYLSARVLALALSCYYENLPEKSFLFLRESISGNEFYFKQNDCYKQTGTGAKQPLAFRAVYKNGEPYLPIRFMAESLGYTVGYRDGLIVIDHKTSTNAIIKDDALFSYAKGLLADFVPTAAEGQTYHVAQSAQTNGDGTAVSPFKTLAAACAVARAGDTVIVHEGTYREVLTPQHDGTAANPIIFRAAEGERVVLSAAETVSGFKKSSENADWVEASVDWDLGDGRNQVYYKEETLVEARYPNNPSLAVSEGSEPLSKLFPTCGDFTVSSDDKTVVTSDTLLNETTADYWKGATFVSMHGYGWTLSTAKIASSAQGSLKLDAASFAGKWWYDAADHDSLWHYGYISGHKHAIDTAGEWVLENGKLIMMPPEGVSADSLSVEVKARQLTMDLSNRKYIQVIGFESFGGGAALTDSEMCILNKVDMRYISHYTLSDDQRDGYITDGSNDAKRNHGKEGAPAKGEVGVYLGGRDNAVVNSKLNTSAAAGIYLGGLYAYIDNNVITNCGYMGSYVSGIYACSEPWGKASDARGGFAVYHNTISNAGRSLIGVQGTEFLNDGHIVDYQWQTDDGALTYNLPYVPFEIAYNDLHGGTLTSMDTGLIYTYMVTCSNDAGKSRIHNNYVYASAGEQNPWSSGLYSDGGSIGIDYTENVIFHTESENGFSYADVSLDKKASTSTQSANVSLKAPLSNGASDLKAEHFPLGRPFYAGAASETPYLLNYNKASDEAAYYPVSGAKLTNASYDADGGVTLSSANDMISFENVDLGTEGANRIQIYYTADKYKSIGTLAVYIGQSLATAKKCEVLLSCNGDTQTVTDIVTADFGSPISGVQNVYIKNGYAFREANASVKGIMPMCDGTAAVHDGAQIMGPQYDRVHQIGSLSMPVHTVTAGNGQYVMNTTPNTVLVYENVTVKEAAQKLTLRLRCFDARTTISFHLNSPDAAAFFKTALPITESAHGQAAEQTYTLTNSLPDGTYDIYVKFSVASTIDLFSFGFTPQK